MTDDNARFEISKPDGSKPTVEDLAKAMHDASAATEETMSCPVTDCSGKIEAHAPLWLEVAPDGRPYLAAIGWMEAGVVTCSHGGTAHVSLELTRSLGAAFQQYCAVAEKTLGATKGEDDLPHFRAAD